MPHIYFFEDCLRLIPEIILIFSISVFSLFGLIYERSKNLPKVSTTIINMCIAVLLFIFWYLLYFLLNYFTQISRFEFIHCRGLLVFGPFVALSKIVCVILLLICYVAIKPYCQFQKFYYFEIPVLFLCVLLGSFIIISSIDLLTLYLGVEIISLSLYVLIGSKKNEHECLEAGVKYFILSSLASALIIMGSAVLYASTGTTNIEKLGDLFAFFSKGNWAKFWLGSLLLLIGLFYKLAVFPFHYWVGDVYVGSPAPVVMLLSSVGKYPIIFFLARYTSFTVFHNYVFFYLFLVLGLLSTVFGSFYAFNQTNVKRLIGYGSIVHSGFIILSLGMFSTMGNAIAITYTTIYLITVLSFFNFFVSTYIGSKRKMYIDVTQYYGLFLDRPKLALSVSLIFFSFMGIPPLVGFFSKFFVLLLISAKLPYLYILILCLTSGIGAFYYFRFIAGMFFFKRSLPYSEPILAWQEAYSSYFIFCLSIIFLIFGAAPIAKFFNFIANLTF